MPKSAPKDVCTAAALARVLNKAGAACPENALPGLAEYIAMLMRWNRVMNLVGARTWQVAAEDLVADCLRLADFLKTLPLPGAPVCWDLGSGAGLPGVPLRLIWTNGTYDMVELRQKRALFLSQVLGTLNLPRTAVHNMDARLFFKDRQADLVVSRAFLPWDQVLALVEPHLADGAHVVFMAREIPAPAELSARAPDFTPAGQHAYACRAGTRCFWAVRMEQRA